MKRDNTGNLQSKKEQYAFIIPCAFERGYFIHVTSDAETAALLSENGSRVRRYWALQSAIDEVEELGFESFCVLSAHPYEVGYGEVQATLFEAPRKRG